MTNNYTYREEFGKIKLYCGGELVATFDGNGTLGIDAFVVFRMGLARQKDATLINERTGEYMIGSVSQLTA